MVLTLQNSSGPVGSATHFVYFFVVPSLVYKSVDYEKMWFIYCFPTPGKVADQLGKSQCKIVHVRNESLDSLPGLKTSI